MHVMVPVQQHTRRRSSDGVIKRTIMCIYVPVCSMRVPWHDRFWLLKMLLASTTTTCERTRLHTSDTRLRVIQCSNHT